MVAEFEEFMDGLMNESESSLCRALIQMKRRKAQMKRRKASRIATSSCTCIVLDV